MKKIIVVSIILNALLILFYLFIEYNKSTQQIAVLSYHNIIPDDVQRNEEEYETLTVSEFEKEIEYLEKNDYKALTANELYEWKQGKKDLPKKSVLITFDDGYYSFKYLVEPILEKHNFKAICFLMGNSTGDITPIYSPDILRNHWKG